ncbi:MAG: Bro-N domain-containing protein [Sterolibacterium sp.]|nr:Bro-N domain-containing protein [Sterolibacterium sp.]
MANSNQTGSVLAFHETEFDVVDIHNVPWLRVNQIGLALSYKNPDLSVSKLFRENADEFTEEMTRLVELDTAGGRQQVRIFSPRGCYLIGMLARTERAKEFRKWVLDVLEGRQVPREMMGRGVVSINQQIAAHPRRLALLKELHKTTDPALRRAIHEQLDHASRLLGLSTPALADIGQDARPDCESPVLEEFWDIFDTLQNLSGGKLNHARGSGLISFNLPQMRAAAAAAKLKLPDLSELRHLLKACRSPRFIDIKTVNSRISQESVKCWVFEPLDADGQEG